MVTDLLEGLSPAQSEAVTTPAAPLAILAGPGSGKTHTLTRRVAYQCLAGRADPGHTLVLTFSRRAATELTGRLFRLGLPTGVRRGGVVAGTFHAVAWAEVSRYRAERGLPTVAVLGRPGRLVARAIGEALGRDPWPGEVGATLSGWSRLRADGLIPHDDVWTTYDGLKRARRVVDLDDLLEQCTEILTGDRSAADAARWRHRHVLVDEYQDLNSAHCRLLHAWVAGRPDVCVVGDPGQAIYGFNGSVPDLFDRLDGDWPGVEVITLGDNFRSTPEIVDLAGAVGSRGRSLRPAGPIPTLTEYADEDSETAAITAALAARRAPRRSWAGMAVLARTNARLRQIGAALDAADIPWRMRDPRPLADHAALASAPDDALATALDLESAGAPLAAALAEYHETSPLGTVRGFISWLDASGATGDVGAPGGVELATFHRAKGLEWPAVWVVGVGDLSPTDEERRLLYVALTRASEELAVSWAGTASEWVGALAAVRARLAASPAPDEQRRRLHELVGLLAAS